MIYVYPKTISTFVGDSNIAIKSGYIEVTEEDYKDLVETKKMWKYGKILEDETYNERIKKEALKCEIEDKIAELKYNLSITDYRAIKFLEGEISAEEYAPTKQERKEWRSRINELENEQIEVEK